MNRTPRGFLLRVCMLVVLACLLAVANAQAHSCTIVSDVICHECNLDCAQETSFANEVAVLAADGTQHAGLSFFLRRLAVRILNSSPEALVRVAISSGPTEVLAARVAQGGCDGVSCTGTVVVMGEGIVLDDTSLPVTMRMLCIGSDECRVSWSLSYEWRQVQGQPPAGSPAPPSKSGGVDVVGIVVGLSVGVAVVVVVACLLKKYFFIQPGKKAVREIIMPPTAAPGDNHQVPASRATPRTHAASLAMQRFMADDSGVEANFSGQYEETGTADGGAASMDADGPPPPPGDRQSASLNGSVKSRSSAYEVTPTTPPMLPPLGDNAAAALLARAALPLDAPLTQALPQRRRRSTPASPVPAAALNEEVNAGGVVINVDDPETSSSGSSSSSVHSGQNSSLPPHRSTTPPPESSSRMAAAPQSVPAATFVIDSGKEVAEPHYTPHTPPGPPSAMQPAAYGRLGGALRIQMEDED